MQIQPQSGFTTDLNFSRRENFLIWLKAENLEEHRVNKKEERNRGDEKAAQAPGAVHLVRGADYLLSVLKAKYSKSYWAICYLIICNIQEWFVGSLGRVWIRCTKAGRVNGSVDASGQAGSSSYLKPGNAGQQGCGIVPITYFQITHPITELPISKVASLATSL